MTKKKTNEKSGFVEPEYKKIKIKDIHPADYNPRVISNEALTGLEHSMERFGCVEPIIVNVRDGRNIIVGGHQRYKAIINKMGDENETVMCVTVDLSTEEEKALNLTLNNPHIQGEFVDIEKLTEYIKELRATMPDEDYLNLRIGELLGEINQAQVEGKTDEDAIPPIPKVAVTKPGDLYLLGGTVKCPKCGKEHAL